MNCKRIYFVNSLFIISAFVFLISCKNEIQLFTQLSSSQTNIHFVNRLTEHDSLNILDYLYFYNGGGVAVGDINGDGLSDIYFTANSKGHNKLYLNKGHLKFEDITARAHVAGNADWCSGVTMADVNGDGLLDIYVCAVSEKLGLKGHNELFINNGNLTFTESAAAYGLDFSGYSMQAVFFDYDHDGDLDCYLLNQSSHSVQTYGDTSIRRKINPFSGDKLFRNDLITPSAGAGKPDSHTAMGGRGKAEFTDVSAQSGIYQSALGYGLGVAVADLNNDGWEDIYVGNDFHENDYYYINNHDGTFTESGAKHFNHYSRFSMGNDIADYNNDGQLDIMTADMLPGDEKVLKTYGSDEQPDIYNYKIVENGYQNQYSRNCLQRNMGNGVCFSDVGLISGIAATDWSWSPLLADFDNDGIKDLFVANGIVKRMSDLDYIKFISSREVQKTINQTKQFDKTILNNIPSGKVHNYIFKGNADERFTDESIKWGMSVPTFSTGAAYADLDNDGDLDLIVNNINDEAGVYRNNATSKNYLAVSCKGNSANTSGIGCKVYLLNNGKIQYQQLMLTRGFQSASEPGLHFGLDTLSNIDSLLIVWPNQNYQLIKNVKANQQLVLEQKNAASVFNYASFFPPQKEYFTNITDSIHLLWKHKENTFFDFNQQYLIPHELSTAGPKIATGDVNGDGLDDFFVCGAKNQPGSLFIQTNEGHFISADTALFKADANCEDANAIFFDADGDGDMDLYVASGGNELIGHAQSLLDRLYLNDGKGDFTKSVNALPDLYANKSSVCAADINHDGDMDLFVGVRANAVYGISQTSYLLINDGKGRYAIADKKIIDLENIGMITDASFADINKDGWPDLVVAGEWMPVSIFINDRGKYKLQNTKLPTGLWQSLYITDINNDGYPDICAGNYGVNSKLHASSEEPLKLYVKDIDGNGTPDQILTYTVDGKEYTFLGKEELEKQLPVIKKKFLRYTDFAGKTVREIFGDQLNGAMTLQAQTLASACFINDGRGNFNHQFLPFTMQLSPIFALYSVKTQNNKNALLSGGNFYGVLPYEGRYDAMPIALCFDDAMAQKNDPKTYQDEQVNFHEPQLLPPSLLSVKGEIRDIKLLRFARNKKALVIARNNDTLLFLEVNE
ncbi:MAG TPA: VCBS repeat-containing protein [Chitinophagaceae bacterium]